MHNRVRMITASFLVKDLHLPWRWGARHFLHHLVDGDLASNNHGWQWAAGTGTDAAPYFRVFNPTVQVERFDPDGEYIAAGCPSSASPPRRARAAIGPTYARATTRPRSSTTRPSARKRSLGTGPRPSRRDGWHSVA